MQELKVAAVQIASEPMNFTSNLRKALDWVQKAKSDHAADLIVLPETITTGFSPGVSAEELWEVVQEIPGPATKELTKLASQLNIYILYPTYERGPAKTIVYNSAVLIGPEGIAGKYRKTHLFPTERKSGGGWTTPGNEVKVLNTKLGKIGIIICFDGDFPELVRVLALQGAEVILRPSAFLRSYEIWELTNRARAYDNHVYVVGVNAVGVDADSNSFFGHSMIVSPLAQTLALARGTEEIISASLHPDPIKYLTYGSKSPMLFDHLEDRNLDVYKGLTDPGRSAFEPYKRIPDK